MASLRDFSRRMQVRADQIGTDTTRRVRRTAIAVDQAVVVGTPVDEGRAKSNWIVQLNAPAGEIIEAYAPGEAGSTEARNTQAALDQGEAVISRYQSGQGQEIHITNNLPYIQRLNDGYSNQAGANFVEQAVLEASAAAQRGGR